MTNKDPGKRHFYVSIAKSILRFAACGYLYFGMYEGAALFLFSAEVLGIAEEL
jgi:hypothetical protein